MLSAGLFGARRVVVAPVAAPLGRHFSVSAAALDPYDVVVIGGGPGACCRPVAVFAARDSSFVWECSVVFPGA